jgi:hypothetical protein
MLDSIPFGGSDRADLILEFDWQTAGKIASQTRIATGALITSAPVMALFIFHMTS